MLCVVLLYEVVVAFFEILNLKFESFLGGGREIENEVRLTDGTAHELLLSYEGRLRAIVPLTLLKSSMTFT
jgi:hypothetical protein